MADLTKWEKAYAAGLFDGEGCVCVYMRKSGTAHGRKDRALRTNLIITGTDLRPLQWLQERWQGSVKIWTPRPNHKAVGAWRVFSNQADIFARDIRPYLLVKAEQLDLWMEARKMMYSPGFMPGGLPEDEVAARRALVAKVSAMKTKGRRVS